MTYQLSMHRDELCIRFYDTVTHHDVIDCCVDMTADPKCQGLSYAVIDFSAADDYLCSNPDLELLVTASRQLVSFRRAKPRVLLVVPESETPPPFHRLQAKGRIELCGTDAQARERIEDLRRA